jgi:hypothetical protein
MCVRSFSPLPLFLRVEEQPDFRPMFVAAVASWFLALLPSPPAPNVARRQGYALLHAVWPDSVAYCGSPL